MEGRSGEHARNGTGALRAWAARQVAALRELRGTPAARAFVVAVAFVALVAALHVLNALVIEGTLLNLSEDWNVPAFASALLFAAAALAALRAAGAIGPDGSGRGFWLFVAVLAAAAGLESLADLHTRLEEVGSLEDVVLVLIPVLGLIAIIVLWGQIRELEAPSPLLLGSAAALIVLSQFVGAFTSTVDVTGAPRDALILVEEVGEMLAPCLVILAAVGVVANREPAASEPARP